MTEANGRAKKEFNREARGYDLAVRDTIPKYSEMHQMIIWGIPHLSTRPLTILELGVGTGNLSAELLRRYPHAIVHGIDISPAMVAAAKRKLRQWRSRVELTVSDLDDWPQDSSYDVIVSCLAVHHLDDSRKRGLFRKVYEALRPGGYFGNGDDHLPEDSRFDERFASLAASILPSQSGKVLPGSLWHDHEPFDHPVPLSSEVTWLKDAGFVHLDTPWRFLNDAVVWAYK